MKNVKGIKERIYPKIVKTVLEKKLMALVIFIVIITISILVLSVIIRYDEPQMFILDYQGVSSDNSSYVIIVSEVNPSGIPCNTNVSSIDVYFSMYDFEMRVSDMPNVSNTSTIAFKDSDGDGHISVNDKFYIGKNALDGMKSSGIDEAEFDRNQNGQDELYMFIYGNDCKIGEIEFEMPYGDHYT